jgi:hypothetical protein
LEATEKNEKIKWLDFLKNIGNEVKDKQISSYLNKLGGKLKNKWQRRYF